MSMLPPQSYFQQLHAYLQWQTQKLQQLEASIGLLQQEIDALKQQRTVRVDKIEYKFDQLKIERLDGTLHIGISPELGKTIEDFTVNGSDIQNGGGFQNGAGFQNGSGMQNGAGMPGAGAPSAEGGFQYGGEGQMSVVELDRLSRIRAQIELYLDEDGRALIGDLERDCRIALGEAYADFMIADLKGQLEKRIAHYSQTVPSDPSDPDAKENAIVDKMKADIRTAIERHIRQKNKQGDESH